MLVYSIVLIVVMLVSHNPVFNSYAEKINPKNLLKLLNKKKTVKEEETNG